MSIYSGFSTRKLEYEYNICVDQILSLLSTRAIKHIHGEKVDEDKFKKIFKKLFKFLQKMEAHKYLHPKYSETLTQLAKVLKLKILDPLKISPKDSKTDIKDYGMPVQPQQQNNMVVINNQQNGNNNVSNFQLINATTRPSSVSRGGFVMNSQQRPMSMDMRSRASMNKRNPPLNQQGIQPLKENIKYANQHQILINNVINVSKNEQDSHVGYQNRYYQPPYQQNNQIQKNINVVSEERSQVNTSHGDFINAKGKEEDLFTLSQVTKKSISGMQDDENKENQSNHIQKSGYGNNYKTDNNEFTFKAPEKLRCKTPPTQSTQNQENLFTLSQQNNDDKLKSSHNGQPQQSQNVGADQEQKGLKGKRKNFKQINDALYLRRESQTQAIPQNLRIEVSVQNTPNTVITGGDFSHKNQISHPIRKKSSKNIRNHHARFSSNQNGHTKDSKESDSSKSLHVYDSPAKQDLAYNSFYVETSSFKNLNKNIALHQRKQLNSNSGKKYAHNQMSILQEIQIQESSTQPHANAHQIQFSDLYKQQLSAQHKSSISPNTRTQRSAYQYLKNADSSDTSQHSTIQHKNYNPNDCQQNNMPQSSHQSSKEQTIKNDSSFKEFLFNSQKQEVPETQFKNRQLAQNLNDLKGDLDTHQQSNSQSLLYKQQSHILDNSANGRSKFPPQSHPLKNKDDLNNPEPQIIQPTQLLPLYAPHHRSINDQQSPRFENDTFGLTDNQLSLTPIKQFVKRKKSKKRSCKQPNEKKTQSSFIITTPKITSVNPNKYTYNISPKNILQISNNDSKA